MTAKMACLDVATHRIVSPHARFCLGVVVRAQPVCAAARSLFARVQTRARGWGGRCWYDAADDATSDSKQHGGVAEGVPTTALAVSSRATGSSSCPSRRSVTPPGRPTSFTARWTRRPPTAQRVSSCRRPLPRGRLRPKLSCREAVLSCQSTLGDVSLI